ncbi:hypothetical protein SLE2022_129810 [Rubroshorea leprosula]
MEIWLAILCSFCIAAVIKALFHFHFPYRGPRQNLPPGPATFPIVGNFLWIGKTFLEIELALRNLHQKLGPMITLHIGPHPAIFVTDRSLIHQALVQNGAVFADRPPALATDKILSSNQHTISTAPYGPTWRSLRRNLTAEMLSPSRIKSYSHARIWVLEILKERLKSKASTDEAVLVVEHLRYAMFCLLVLMCFGDKLDENQIKQIEDAERRMLLGQVKFSVLNLWPRMSRILFYKRWEEFFQIRRNEEEIFIPLIRARKSKAKEDRERKEDEHENVLSYVDTLLDLQLPEEKRKLDEHEMVSLCAEFLDGGTDTTATALQWIMANLVKYPDIQENLFMEIQRVVGERKEEVITEDELHKMPYLKAVILEGLRRHPPGHFVLPHRVTEDAVLNGFLVPRNGTVNFLIAQMGWDPKVWEDPMAFKPERFLNGSQELLDITGSKEIKMMPFGAGRRFCPGYSLATLHLEYFVANLVWCFEWKAVQGDDIDLSEMEEFTVVMKFPLQARIYPRTK